MSQTAKLFTNGRSQAVRLPAAYRFPGDEVFIRKDDVTGDVILSSRPPDGADNLEKFFALIRSEKMPEDFLSEAERRQPETNRDLFADWVE
jgi:antitoxin VapB